MFARVPDTLAPRPPVQERCSDGAAAASTGAGMVGPILAFRGEIEAHGRGLSTFASDARAVYHAPKSQG